MSSRAVRKLLKDQGYDDLQANFERIEQLQKQKEETSKSTSKAPPKKINAFDLLATEENQNIAENPETKDESSLELDSSSPAENQKQTGKLDTQQTAKISKKKVSKKRQAKSNPKKNVNSIQLDELEKHIQKLSVNDSKSENQDTQDSDIRSMNAETEIKKMLGNDFSNVVKKDKREKMYRIHPNLERPRYIFAKPGLTWPPMKRDNGLSISQIDLNKKEYADIRNKVKQSQDYGLWFSINYSKRYKSSQMDFYIALNTHDPRSIQFIIHNHPYHVDGLLQFALTLEQSGCTLEEVCEYIERALFALETALGPGFGFSSANCCWKSAWEVSKALLGLDPSEDPLGVMFLLDYNAIKAKKYSFVSEFFEKWPWDTTLLPNWVYSVATAQFMQELATHKSNKKNASLHSLNMKHHEKSLKLLVKAILTFPTVIPKLFSKASISIPQKIAEHKYFKEVSSSFESAYTHLEVLVDIFAERNSNLYRSREASQWLNQGVNLVLERLYDAGIDPDIDPYTPFQKDFITDTDILQGIRMTEKYCKYEIPINVARHVIISDYTQIIAKFPQSLIERHQFAFDPLPPPNDINEFSDLLNHHQMQDWSGLSESNVRDLIDELENYDNPDDFMGRIVRRILPWLRQQPLDARLGDLRMGNERMDFGAMDDDMDSGSENEVENPQRNNTPNREPLVADQAGTHRNVGEATLEGEGMENPSGIEQNNVGVFGRLLNPIMAVLQSGFTFGEEFPWIRYQ
ncbi:hypothetical protein BB560_000306 [Smittium megazygosporum]|uniref:Uncharacterized protein n=1 Tax=Smittium megazygosporum TaxID=133381 RepID=A0A2T9ZKV4_9FUNG|nr:hypothetical protein BB560_000306 [Smittium megazygosporum]